MGRIALASVVAGLAAAPAAAQEPLISADTYRLGRIDLHLDDVEGARGTFYELVGERRVRVGEVTVTGPGAVTLRDALTWSCTRRTRRLVADVLRPDGSTASARYAVRTPGCHDRLLLEAPGSARPGSEVTARVIDRWALGDVRPRLCVRSPAGRSFCRVLRLGPRGRAAVGFPVDRDGVWRLGVWLHRFDTRRSLYAGLESAPVRPAERPRMLVTGDSTVQGIDVYLGDRLRRSVRLERRFQPGTAIGHDWDHWPALAARTAREVEPRVTVMSIGATEGYPMRTPAGPQVACCDRAWQAEHERRTRRVMRSLVRAGRARVLWLTLPAPQDPRRALISEVVNASTIRAAAAVRGVVVVRVDRVLSPRWRFRRAVRYRGERRVVRAADGIHLTPAGAAIAADLVIRALGRLDLAE